MRYSNNMEIDGFVKNGFDYSLQVWVENFIIQNCGHKTEFLCSCNGKKLKGQDIRQVKK